MTRRSCSSPSHPRDHDSFAQQREKGKSGCWSLRISLTGRSSRRFPWGDTISFTNADFYNRGSESYALGKKGYHPSCQVGEYPYTSPVDVFAPNGYGLYGMVGNVWEWCWDWHGSYPSESATDPRGPSTGADRVSRGGSWVYVADGCRLASSRRTEPLVFFSPTRSIVRALARFV